MGRFISNFETTAAFEAAEINLATPHVSLTKDDMQIHFKPYTYIDGHEYVDLGLPSGTMWATMNVGASSITDYGTYHRYANSCPYSNNFQDCGGVDYAGMEDPLSSSNDTAAQVWGGSWHTPTRAQMQELTANTTYEWTTINGVNGGKFTATNGNYVFFPAAGYWDDGSKSNVGSNGGYWGSSPNGSNYAYGLYFDFGDNGVYGSLRKGGCSVRPVVG